MLGTSLYTREANNAPIIIIMYIIEDNKLQKEKIT